VPLVTIYGGNDVAFPPYTFLDADNVGIDISDWAWSAEWRKTPSNSVALPLVVDATDAATGTLRVSVTGETSALMKGDGHWDLTGELLGLTLTLIYGGTRYIKNVTRD
jgi:hypothetical protein